MTSPVQTWRYAFPSEKGEGWAIIFMDSIGCFAALSDWGDVAYRWPQQGWGPGDFRAFVLQCDDSYLVSKFAGPRNEYDPEGTLAGIKRWIAEELKQSRRRMEEDLLRRFDDVYSQRDFEAWTEDTKLPDPRSFYRLRPCSEATQFVARVMPRLRVTLREELQLAPSSAS